DLPASSARACVPPAASTTAKASQPRALRRVAIVGFGFIWAPVGPWRHSRRGGITVEVWNGAEYDQGDRPSPALGGPGPRGIGSPSPGRTQFGFVAPVPGAGGFVGA